MMTHHFGINALDIVSNDLGLGVDCLMFTSQLVPWFVQVSLFSISQFSGVNSQDLTVGRDTGEHRQDCIAKRKWS